MTFQANPAPAVLAPSLGYSEITPRFTRRWRNALKGVRNGTGNARVLCLGDSTTAGAGAGTSGAYNYVGAATRGWPARLPTTELPYRFTGFSGCQFVNGQQSFTTFDTRFAFTGGASVWQPGASILSGDAFSCTNGQAGSVTFTPGQAFDRVEVIYASAPSNSTLGVSATGGGSDNLGNITTNTTAALRSSGVLNCTAPRTALTISWLNDQSFGCPVLGIMTWSSGAREVQVLSAGWAGGTIANIANVSQYYSSANGIAAFNPDLVLICGGTLNDASAGTAAASWLSTAQGLVNLIRGTAGADIAWVTGNNVEADSSNANNLVLNQQVRLLCAENNISVLDMHERWRPRATWAPAGSFYYDSRHPSFTGYGDYAAMIGRFMRLIAEGQAD